MNETALLLRALRGPFLLITLGTLFALQHAGGMRFTKTWPVLIILYGVLRLLERAANHGAEPPVPPVTPPATYGGPTAPGGYFSSQGGGQQ